MSFVDPTPIQAWSGPPASATPLRDLLGEPHPSVSPDYVVLPRSLVESMPLPWQHQMAALLAELHAAFARAPWPRYQITPTREAPLNGLDEAELAQVGVHADLDDEGDLVYRDARTGAPIPDADERIVQVRCSDPLTAFRVPTPPASPPTWPASQLPP